jgi:hypothetical protein
MRNVLDEFVHQMRTHFKFHSFFFSKIVSLMRMPKITLKSGEPQNTSQYGAYELHAGEARLHARMCIHICSIYCFSTAKLIRERASILRYTCIACLVTVLGCDAVCFDR